MHNYFFPTVFSFLFSMSLFNTLNILQLHDYKDYYSWKHFNVLPCKLCNVYFNCVFTNLFFHHYGYFFASLHIRNFFHFKFVYFNLRIFILQYTDGTRTSLQVTEDQDSRTWHKSHGWLKRAKSAKEEETIFH